MITTRLSSKGQIVIPRQIREQLHLQKGAEFSLAIEGDNLILQRIARRDWREWEGAFPELDLLGERNRKRREELRRDARKVKS